MNRPITYKLNKNWVTHYSVRILRAADIRAYISGIIGPKFPSVSAGDRFLIELKDLPQGLFIIEQIEIDNSYKTWNATLRALEIYNLYDIQNIENEEEIPKFEFKDSITDEKTEIQEDENSVDFASYTKYKNKYTNETTFVFNCPNCNTRNSINELKVLAVCVNCAVECYLSNK